MVVAIVALVVIGPKDLPGMFRELGRFTAKIRAMGREFSRAMEQAAKETGVKEVADDLRKVTSPKAMGLDAVRSAADKFEKWDPLRPVTAATAKAAPLTPPPMPATTVAASAAAAAAPGSATAALAQEVAAKKVASVETATKLRAAKAAPKADTATILAPTLSPAIPPTDAPAPKRGGRVRKTAKPDTGDAA
jgi:sec-independent protein translocase protein TatB